MKSIDAKEIVKAMNWIMHTEGDGEPILSPTYNQNSNVYECTLDLPLISKTVIGIGESKIEAVENACSKSVRLIEEFESKYPKFKVNNCFDGNYVLEEDDKGSLSIRVIKSKAADNRTSL